MAKPKPFPNLRWLFLIPIPALWCVASYFGTLDFLENKLLDWRFRARGELPAPIKVVYVDIDSESTTDLGNWPWDRGYFAEVGDALLRAGAVRAIGVDAVFSQKGQFELVDHQRFEAGNRALAAFLFEAPPVVLAAGYAASEDRDINGQPIVRQLPRVALPPAKALPPEQPEFALGDTVWTPPHVGLIDTIDGGTRWVPLFARTEGRTFLHMALELARLYWKLPPDAVQIDDHSVRLRNAQGAVLASIPLRDGQDVEVNWFSRWSSPEHNPRASFVEALAHAQHLKSGKVDERRAAEAFFQQFTDAVVLIGAADPLLQDIAPTPLDPRPVPRVGIHGNLLKTIVSGLYLRRPALVWEIALVAGLTLLVTALAVGTGRRSVWLRAAAGLVLAAYTAGAFLLFAKVHWVVPMTGPLGAALSTSFAAVAWQLIREEKQKGRIKSMFGTYVSPELVERMVDSGEDPKLGGAEVEITAYFSDIQDFSSFSEQLSPPQIVELMNEYLSACTDLVTAEGGTLDKYIGDAVVAMFGAPVALQDHAFRACLASQRVQTRLRELRSSWSRAGHWPEGVGRMRTRIGLNSGAAVVGNMGSRTRFNYTMMGDSVNLAARLESAAKTYGATTLLTEATLAACGSRADRFLVRNLDRIVVKGRSAPVQIFELLGLRTELPDAVQEGVAVFEKGVAAYLAQDWENAARLFQESAALEMLALEDRRELTPSSVYLERISLLRSRPPGRQWDGVWVMQSK